MTPERLSIQRRIVAVCHHDSDGLKTADRMEVPTPGRPRNARVEAYTLATVLINSGRLAARSPSGTVAGPS